MLDSRIKMSPNISYSFGKEATHMNIWVIGINLKKASFLLRKLSIVNSTCLELVTKIMNTLVYRDLYLPMDVILLANVFEAFWKVCLDNYGLDPAHFYTAPGLAWCTCLKKTRVRLELLLDPDMLLMFERGIRGGITQSIHRWAKANNPYMGFEYAPREPTRYIQYLDANNLYGWAMS